MSEGNRPVKILPLFSVLLISMVLPLRAPCGPVPGSACADANGDGGVDLADAILLIAWLFQGGNAPSCPDPAVACGDVNGDVAVDLTDAVAVIGHLFLGGPPPSCRATTLLLPGFVALGDNAQGYPEYRHEATGAVFVLLPEATFAMGAQAADPKGRNYDPKAQDFTGETIVHDVALGSFLIGKYEITQGQWLAAMGSNPSFYTPGNFGERDLPPKLLEGDGWKELPVDSASWDEVQRFEGRTGLSLPTEAQWEYACRAGTSGPVAGTGVLDDMMACGAVTVCSSTLPAGTKKPNDFGLHDMHGNVFEWCEDVFEEAFYLSRDAAGPDPLSTWSNFPRRRRIFRGGAGSPLDCRSGWRFGTLSDVSDADKGFRAALYLAPRLELERERLDFGLVALGRSSTLRLRIRNTGALPLIVSRIGLSAGTSAGFEVTAAPAPGSIVPGTGLEIEVRYTPSVPAGDGGELEIEMPGGDATSTVVLAGAGVEAPAERKIAGFSAVGANEQGFLEYRHDATGLVFVFLPGGDFLMGAQRDEADDGNFDPEANSDNFFGWGTFESPVHTVTLSPFLIAKHEVTQAVWTTVMGSNPSVFQGKELPEGTDSSQFPVEQVSWDDVQAFGARNGLGLPTEAQWEYACRAGVQGPIAGTGRMEEMTSCGPTALYWGGPVGSRRANGFGLHDLQGGVWEWCQDFFDPDFYRTPEAAGPDPLSEGGSQVHIVRGNHAGDVPWMCRAAVRRGYPPDRRSELVGFRPAMPVK